jgi:hypothetical protein
VQKNAQLFSEGSSAHAPAASLSVQKTSLFLLKDIGRTVIRPISLRRVTAGAHVLPAAFHTNQS